MRRVIGIAALLLGIAGECTLAQSLKEPQISSPPGVRKVHEFRLDGPVLDRLRENKPGLADVRSVRIRRYQFPGGKGMEDRAATVRAHYQDEMTRLGWYLLTDDSYGLRRGAAFSSQDGQWLFAFNMDPRGLVTTLVDGKVNLYQIPELERAMLKFLVRGSKPFASHEEAEQIRTAFKLQKQNKYADAVSLLEKAVAKDSDSAPLRQALAELYDRQGQPIRRLAQLKAIVALDPSAYMPRVHYGKALYESKMYTEALFELQQAATLAPDKGTPHYFIGRIYEDQKHFKDALAAYKQADERGPGWISVAVRMAQIHEQMGDWTAAEANYRKALRIKPDYAPAKEGLARVQKKL